MRWDLIDRFSVLKKGRYSLAEKAFSGGEDFFSEHVPGKPLVPEPLLVEMIAQTGGVLFGLGLEFRKEVILAKIASADFENPVAPPCRLVIEAFIEDESEDAARVSGTVRAEGGRVVARAEIFLVAMKGLGEAHAQKIVFNEKFLTHYDVFNVARASEKESV
ncbi:MAG TPA: beta-hydroxyacyl-ACP dehydratase [Candidatus Eisenbacteria bacterium]|jgi:3-hydroxyacyl-[acyl-carrier-protein] dehydratase|nr:beta-hydroxyacyl-ACP dehydratase [Candidatus Eisenbacteria bacterium]